MSKSRNLLFSPPDYGGWRVAQPFMINSQTSGINMTVSEGQRCSGDAYFCNIWEKLRGQKLLIAFSGGKDSLALLHYVLTHKSLMGWDIVVCCVNHNLRGEESRRDAEFCRDWCSVREILYIETDVDVKNSSETFSRGIEYAARKYRYKALEEARIKSDCGFILTAHTLDDQLESFFVDLMTGVSVFTAGGIEASGGYLARPFLKITTDDVLEYIKYNSLLPVYDSSNDDLRYSRNLVRQKLIPVVKELGSGIINAIVRVQAESAILKEWMDRRTADAVCYIAEGGVAIDRKQLNEFSDAERLYLIGKWLSFFCRGGRVHTEALLKQLYRQRSARHNLPEGWLCEITPRTVRMFPAGSVAPFCMEKPEGIKSVELHGGRTLLFPPCMLDKAYRIRSRKNGDKYNGKKLKDLFEKRGIDLYLRDRAVVVEDSCGIVWVEHLKNSPETAIEIKVN
jgi:tRNA(Ile)-lysidine synthase